MSAMRDRAGRFVAKDHGYDALVERALGMRPVAIAAGILAKDGERAEGDLTLIEVAVWNHFGVPDEEGGWRIPPRRFISDWFDSEGPHLREKLSALMRLVVAGKLSRDQALEQMGAYCVGQIQQRIADKMYTPNAPSTEARKRSSTPLVASGQLRASVSFEIREGRGE